MTDGEWDIFWAKFDSCRESSLDILEEDEAPPQIPLPKVSKSIAPVVPNRNRDGEQTSTSTRVTKRSHRCGVCVACRSSDCGLCKNCRDKPRFGGPGVKKKACVARICHRSRRPDDAESDDDLCENGSIETSPDIVPVSWPMDAETPLESSFFQLPARALFPLHGSSIPILSPGSGPATAPQPHIHMNQLEILSRMATSC